LVKFYKQFIHLKQKSRGGKMKRDFDNNQGGKEKRKYPREEIITDVSYKVLTPSEDKGLTQDISQGGLCLLLNNELPPGTIIEVKFRLPDEDSKLIETFVKVVWQKKTDTGFLTGVKFGTE
jgi:c-di-GMP-binding flagellar brake protein YcgR